MYESPKAEKTQDWILVRLIHDFMRSPGSEIEVGGKNVELDWTQWINERADFTTRPSNTMRRFRELREEWRKHEKRQHPNRSRLFEEAGVNQIDRIKFTPLKLTLVQRVSFDPRDSALFQTDTPISLDDFRPDND